MTFAGSGDAFGSGGRYQSCIHMDREGRPPVLLDCGATSLSALKALDLDPSDLAAVFVSHLHGDHFGGIPFLILDGQFAGRTAPLTLAGPPGITERLQLAMEVMFPGSSSVQRRFGVEVVEMTQVLRSLSPGSASRAWEVIHPSGAPSLALRLNVGGKIVAYTGDTAWTDALIEVAADADLLIAEAYYFDKSVPYHLRLTDLTAHMKAITKSTSCAHPHVGRHPGAARESGPQHRPRWPHPTHLARPQSDLFRLSTEVRAALPLWAVVTRNPSRSRYMRTRETIFGSSSTTKMGALISSPLVPIVATYCDEAITPDQERVARPAPA